MAHDLRYRRISPLVLVHLVLQRRLHRGPERDIARPQSRLHELRVVEIVVVPQTQGRDDALQDQRLVVHRAEGLGGVGGGGLVLRVQVESLALDAGAGDGVEDADLLDKSAVCARRIDTVGLAIGIE